MKDIPMFTTPYGVASLSLREVPYQKAAYIYILSADQPEMLLEECVSFCRACGAEKVYAKGHPTVERYPLYTVVWLMQCDRAQLIGTSAKLFPVLPENVHRWREIYNLRMKAVPNASYMTDADANALCRGSDGYYIHNDGHLIGIGKASGDRIHVVASLQKGMGECIVRTLAEVLDAPTVSVEVASENHAAVCLYQRLGFIKIAELSAWYCVFSGKGN